MSLTVMWHLNSVLIKGMGGVSMCRLTSKAKVTMSHHCCHVMWTSHTQGHVVSCCAAVTWGHSVFNLALFIFGVTCRWGGGAAVLVYLLQLVRWCRHVIFAMLGCGMVILGGGWLLWLVAAIGGGGDAAMWGHHGGWWWLRKTKLVDVC